VRLSFAKPAATALVEYAAANAFTRRLEDKFSAPMLEKFKQSVLIHIRGSATSMTARLPLVPSPSLIHFEEYLKAGFDKEYPDHLPPNPEFGSPAEFTNFLAQARQAGHLTMPYTNPTFWGVDPKGPTFLATNDAPLLVNYDGTINYEEYFGHGGFTVTPWHPYVQAANRNTRNQFITNYPVDMIFHDQLGARTWQYDMNPESPSPYAYIEGLVQIANEDANYMGLSTENGYDRLINHEAQFCGLAWGLAPTANAPVWRRYLRDRYAPSTWTIFPLAQYVAHDKLSFTYNNLEAAVHNHEVMAWTLGLGYSMTYVTEPEILASDETKREWLKWVNRIQKSVAARYMGQGIHAFQHRWGTDPANPDNGAIASRFGSVSVIGNLGTGTLTTNGWTLPPYGYVATATGLIAGHVVSPGSTNSVAYVAESNGTTNVRFWIYGAGGQSASIVLPSGYTGNATLQIGTNSPVQTQTTGSVITVALPASSSAMLWSGSASFVTASTPILIDFGRHDGTNGFATTSPDLNGNYWNNMSPPANGSSLVTVGTKITNLVDQTNGLTSLSIETLTGGWNANGLLNGGLFQPYGPTNALLGTYAIESATMDYFFTGTNDAFKITGLNTNSSYNFMFFGSRSDAVERVTSYAIGSTSITLRTSGPLSSSGAAGTNRNNFALAGLSAITPGPAGDVTVRVTRVTGAFAHLNLMQIQEVLPSPVLTAGISVSPASLGFSATQGGPDPAALSFGLTNTGTATLNYSISTNASWLSVSPASGSLAAGNGQQMDVSVVMDGLQAGTSNALITILDPAASNSPQTVSISLVITNPPVPVAFTQAVYLIDFGRHDSGTNGLPTSNPDHNGNYWNNFGNLLQGVSLGSSISNLVSMTNGASTAGITINSSGWSCNGKLNGGLLTPSPALLGILAVTNATMDYFFTQTTNTSFLVTGLDPSRLYNLEFFGTRDTNQIRVTTYASGTNAVALTTSGAGIGTGGTSLNNNTTAVLRALSPDGSGQLPVTVAATTGGFGYMGILKIEEVSMSASTNPAPVISLSPAALMFTTRYGSASNPASQAFSITNTGSAPLNYTITSNANWLSIAPVSGIIATGAGQQIIVSVNNSGLNPGVSNALITISDPTAINSPRTVNVALSIQSTNPTLAVFGSSVAKGWSSSGFTSGVTTNGSWTNGYAYFITRHLTENYGYYVTNASTPGDNTAAGISRFPTYVNPIAPTYVLLGYSLGNEGLAGSTGTTSSNIVQAFKNNLMTLVSMCRSNGYYPVIGSVYPRGNYSSENYAILKQTHLDINTWNVPSLNLLTPIDDGTGRWINGYWRDEGHPNDAGYYEFYLSLVPTLFAAIDGGQTNRPAFGSPTNFARLTYSPDVNQPLEFNPGDAMRSFTVSFRMSTGNTGTVLAVRSSGAFATLDVRSNALVYVSRAGVETVMSTGITDSAWHDIAVSHRYALSNTVVYLDGTLAATIPEQFAPDQFILGGPGSSGRAPTPASIDLQRWCIYRAGWTIEEANAQRQGSLQQSSMEIGAMLDDASFTNGTPVRNAAQSLSVAMVNTTSLIARSESAPVVTSNKLMFYGSSVAKGWNGGGAETNGSFRFGYAGRSTPVLEAGGWTVTNASVAGNNTALAIARFHTDAVPQNPDVLFIGLSMANEGLLSATPPDQVLESFRSGLTNLIYMARTNSMLPVIGLAYSHSAYTTNHFEYIKRMNLIINSWDVPSVNLLGAVDDGLGRWATGYRSDDGHPNTAGHEEMFHAFPPGLFDALMSGKTNPPALSGSSGFARVSGASTAPFTFTPSSTMHSFNTAFRVRSTSTGTVAAVMTSTSSPAITMPSRFLIDFGRHDGGSNGTATVSPDINGNYWNNISPANPVTNNDVAVGTAINNMITVSNVTTSVRLEITSSGWAANGRLNGGLLSPSNSLLGHFAIGTATEDYFFHSTTGTLKLAGLNPSSSYKLRFFGSRLGTEVRITTFSAGTASTNHQTTGAGIGTYIANQNDDEIAELSGLAPDSSGELPVTVIRAGTNFAHLGVMEIIETPGVLQPAGGTIEIRENTLVYVATNGSEVSAAIDANDGSWIDVALSHSYARNTTMLYIDGVLAGTTTEKLVPVQFILGGAGTLTNRVPSPSSVDLQDWCVYRAPWTTTEAMAQHTGALQQASMEILLPLDDSSFMDDGSPSNRAQTLAAALVTGTNITAGLGLSAPVSLSATSPAFNTVSLSWIDAASTETGYIVERRPADGNSFWSNRVILAANATGYMDYAVSAGLFEYRVSALDGSGQSDYAGPASVLVADPSYSGSVPVARFSMTAGQPMISFVGSNAVVYTLQFNTNLMNPLGWQYVTSNGIMALVIGNGTSTNTLGDTNVTDQIRTYRLMSPP